MSSSDEYDEFPKESEDCDVVSWMYEDEVGEDDARDDDKDDDEEDEDDDAIVPTRDVLLPEPDEEVEVEVEVEKGRRFGPERLLINNPVL